jgi:hypothetical protein
LVKRFRFIVTATTAFWYRFRLSGRPDKLPADKLLAPGKMERVGDAESEEWDNLHLLLVFDYLLLDTPLAKAEGILVSQNRLADAELLQHR